MFDANAHPTVDGAWMDGRGSCGFRDAEAALKSAGFIRAVAVGLPGVGSYSHENFAQMCKGEFWLPVAAFQASDLNADNLQFSLERIRASGFIGIKIHPRLLGWSPKGDELGAVLRAARDCGLRILICSYPFGKPGSGVRGDLLEILSDALGKAAGAKIMLMHAGCVDFLRFVEFARACPDVLLDLSFTIMKYQGSSLDQDLRYAFQQFDRRICIGTDYPEFTPASVAGRVNQFMHDAEIDSVKRHNIASANLERFFGLTS